MKQNARNFTLLSLALVLGGCTSVKPERVSSLERQVNDLQTAVSNLKRETEAELRRLGSPNASMLTRVQFLETQVADLKRKLDTFCVVTRGGRWDRFRPSGDAECNIK